MPMDITEAIREYNRAEQLRDKGIAEEAEKDRQNNIQGSYVDLAGKAFRNESFAGGVLKNIQEDFTTGGAFLDSSFDVNKELPDTVIKKYPAELHNYLLDAKSKEELEYKLEEADTLQAYKREIESRGILTSLPALAVGSLFGDPTTYLTGGFGVAAKGIKGAKAGYTMTEAMIAAGIDTVAAKAVQPQMQWKDVAIGVAGAGVLNTGLVALGKTVGAASKGVVEMNTQLQGVLDDALEADAKATFRSALLSNNKVHKPTGDAEEVWLDKYVDDVFEYHQTLGDTRATQSELLKAKEQHEVLKTTTAKIESKEGVLRTGEVPFKLSGGVIDTQASTSKLPEIKAGYTRLYRASNPKVSFDDVFDRTKLTKFNALKVSDEFYTADLEYADYFRSTYGEGSSIQYIDVADELAQGWKISDLEFGVPKDISKFKTDINKAKVDEAAKTLSDSETNITMLEKKFTELDAKTAGLAAPQYNVADAKSVPSITASEAITADEAAYIKASQKTARGLRPYITKLAKSITGQVLSSENDVAVSMMYQMGEYGPGFGGKYSRGRTIAVHRDVYDRTFMSNFAPRFQEAEQEYFKATKTSLLDTFDRGKQQHKFSLDVQRELNSRRFTPQDAIKSMDKANLTKEQAAVMKAADAISSTRKQMWFNAKDSGVDRFQTAGFRADTTARKWVPSQFFQLAKSYQRGWLDVEDLLHKAIRNAIDKPGSALGQEAGKEVSERLSRAWARAIVRRHTQGIKNVQGFTNDLFSIEDRAFITEVLADAGLDEVQRETFLRAIDKTRQANTTAAVIEMDLNTSHNGHDVWELLDPNLSANMVREIKRTAGEIAMAKAGYKSQKEFNDKLELVTRYALMRGFDIESAKNDVLYLDSARKLILGETLEADPAGALSKGLQVVRDMVQLGSLNWAGFAQLSEFGKVTSRIGVKSMVENVAMFKTLVRDMKTGKLNNTWVSDLEDAFQFRIGDDHIMNNPSYRLDANGMGQEIGWDSKGLVKFSSLIRRLKHVQGFVNGMNLTKTMQDRVLAAGLAKKICKTVDADNLSEGAIKRLVDIGIDEDMIPRVRAMIQAQDWKNTNSMGIAKWSDVEAQEAVMLSMQRAWSQDIQRAMVGEQYLWTQSTLGKLFSQFRTFTLGAIEKQTLHSLRMHDTEAFMLTTYGMLFGTAAYLAKVHTQAISEPDSKKFLDDRLQTQAIVAGGANLLGQSSVAPELFHLAGWVTGQEDYDLFRYSMDRGTGITRRGSGADLGALAPSGAYVQRLLRTIQNSSRAMTDPEFNTSRRDAEDLIKILPLADNMWSGGLWNSLLEGLPERN